MKKKKKNGAKGRQLCNNVSNIIKKIFIIVEELFVDLKLKKGGDEGEIKYKWQAWKSKKKKREKQ